MARHTSGKVRLIPGSTGKLFKFYAVFGILLVIVPMMGLISFALFMYGLTSKALLGNDTIESDRKIIEISVHNIIMNVETLDHFVKQHLSLTEKESHSELMSIRNTEEHARLKEENLKKRKDRLSEIENKLKNIKKMRSRNIANLQEGGKNLIKNKNLIKKAVRYFDDLIWLSIFSLSVMWLGYIMAKTGFKRQNEVSGVASL